MTDGFIEVKSRRKKKSNKTISRSSVDLEYVDIGTNVVTRYIDLSRNKLRESSILNWLLENLSKSLETIDEVLCYGLGNFSESYISRAQLATLLAVKDHYQAKVCVYDPLFLPTEISVLGTLGIQVITLNEEGKRTLAPNSKTLVFFPHCPKQLVNNFLWKNWGPTLQNCVIISNSFTSIFEKNTKSTLDSLSCIRDIISITKETEFEVATDFADVFNDLSIHAFGSFQSVPHEFWVAHEEPKYSEDIEFISREVAVRFRVF